MAIRSGSGAHRQKAVGDGVAGVVVAMDAEMVTRHVLGDFADSRLDLMRQDAAVGVAQDHPSGAVLVGGGYAT